MELPPRIGLDAQAYLTVQQIHRGWPARHRGGHGADVVAGARGHGTRPPPGIRPRATVNWTFLPANWMALRAQWQYSHALSAVINLVALVALICCVLARKDSTFALREHPARRAGFGSAR